VHPAIRPNYYDDPYDMKVMIALVRRALDIATHWPGNRKIGPVMIPPFLAEKHGHTAGTEPSDALLEDIALHFSLTVYHHTCTCRIGDVVDPRLRFWVWRACAWPMPASCPTSPAATPMPHPS
jgi:choline dehydrogenase